MIEKILKIVKSNNKKRGRNITVGAVVGFLLSCTAVMGADEYLWIKNDGGAIKFSTDSNTPSNIENPYGENTWDGVDYVNNITLNSTSTDYGLKLEGDLTGVNFTNNGLIESTKNGSYGIRNDSDAKIGNIINNGIIKGKYGIQNNGTINGIIANNGLIAGAGEGGSMGIYISGMRNANSIYNAGLIIEKGESNNGIYIQGYLAKDIINDGVISSNSISSVSNYEIYIYGEVPAIKNNGLMAGRNDGNGNGNVYGVYNQTLMGGHTRTINTGSIINTVAGTGNAAGIYNSGNSSNKFYVTNSGLIAGAATGSGAGYGIFNKYTASSAEIEAIVNTGVIYGKTSAIENQAGETITSIDNYGILVTEGSSVIDNAGTITNTPTNYGLYIEGTTGVVTIDPSKVNDRPIDIVVSYSNDNYYVTNEIKRSMTIKNASLVGNSGSATSTKSIEFTGGANEFDNSILNGKNDTLRVSGSNREVKGSIINAYGTAVAFDGTDSQLTLSGTIVNGGIDGTNSITGSSNADTLILQAGDITYAGSGSPVSQNTV
ncbi:autotransporter domain-containing protein, partial [Fusobacterium sp. THCT1E2]